MRDDMDKVLVERPRLGGGGVRKGRSPRDPELLPRFQGLRRQAREHGGHKQLNENLAPLRRYLERQLGRPWNTVHGEMRARIDTGNTVQAHIMTHVDQFIRLRVTKTPATEMTPCGLIYQAMTWGDAFRPVRERDLYVDPDDGIIKRARRRLAVRPRAKPPGTTSSRHLAPGRIGVEVDGVWYGVTLKTYQLVSVGADSASAVRGMLFDVEGDMTPEWMDPFLGPVWAWDKVKLKRIADAYGPGMLARDKRQLSRRDLARHGLANRTPP
jgi:hypothetical protein